MSRPLTAPRLTDGVVVLRLPVDADADAVFTACQDPEISRFTALAAPYERHHATDWIAGAPEAWRNGRAAPMVILDVLTDELLGACGLLEIKDDQAEIGYWVKREARRRGVATRSVRLLTDWALTGAGFALIELLTDVRNAPSQRVAEQAGYARDGEVEPPARCASRCETVVRFVRQAPG